MRSGYVMNYILLWSKLHNPDAQEQNSAFQLRFLQKSEKENCLSFPRKWESSILNGLHNTLDSRLPAGRQVSTGMTTIARGS